MGIKRGPKKQKRKRGRKEWIVVPEDAWEIPEEALAVVAPIKRTGGRKWKVTGPDSASKRTRRKKADPKQPARGHEKPEVPVLIR